MDHYVSRSEKKRQAKDIEKISHELAELPASDLARLPCDDFLKEEIKLVRKLKGGSRKRQIKHIAKELRQQPVEEILSFLAEQKGSSLQTDLAFHGLEKLRDDLLGAAIDEYNAYQEKPGYFYMDRDVPILHHVIEMFPDLDVETIVRSVENFAVTRKPKLSREVFRILKAAAERKKYSEQGAI
ncbi:MAG: DUF615 domain-containing protein [Proteobacteria bacterium]|nr:DUF615 domain-containing protein [Pseudomonadota bacterium]MBU1738114.1 DUF615 domain-containing protein [Pseudomonadota bacterium]